MKAYYQCEERFWPSEVMMQAAQAFFVLEGAYLDRRDIQVGLVNVIYPFQRLLEYLGQIDKSLSDAIEFGLMCK